VIVKARQLCAARRNEREIVSSSRVRPGRRRWQFGELTIGAVPIPKWLPLGAMTLGIALVAVAFHDDLMAVLRGRLPAYRAPSQFEQIEG
jgi:hypothetical protein